MQQLLQWCVNSPDLSPLPEPLEENKKLAPLPRRCWRGASELWSCCTNTETRYENSWEWQDNILTDHIMSLPTLCRWGPLEDVTGHGMCVTGHWTHWAHVTMSLSLVSLQGWCPLVATDCWVSQHSVSRPTFSVSPYPVPPRPVSGAGRAWHGQGWAELPARPVSSSRGAGVESGPRHCLLPTSLHSLIFDTRHHLLTPKHNSELWQWLSIFIFNPSLSRKYKLIINW